LGLGVQGSCLRVDGIKGLQGFGLRVWGLGFKVQILGFRVQGVGFRVHTV
jgi:hypothetical protein